MRICIVDYGVGNLFSVEKAFRHLDAQVTVSEDPEEIGSYDALVLPGVGSFQAGMDGLRIRGLIDVVLKHVAEEKPLLGICLGAQLLLTSGREFGEHKGLDIIQGSVLHFPELIENRKTPHIGWNTVEPATQKDWQGTILDNLPKDPEMYFVHSYILQPSDSESVLALTEYGGCTFPSVIQIGNIYGCQFHPEKSGEHGLRIIQNFLAIK
ncbi:MAG: imidazole glycerol phosphate synthase subunit HisH [Kiritimatiellales bacterium]|nr:imidazole glycerol phosphate synthase subunit HisH [Kiritimatiellales bacterium]